MVTQLVLCNINQIRGNYYYLFIYFGERGIEERRLIKNQWIKLVWEEFVLLERNLLFQNYGRLFHQGHCNKLCRLFGKGTLAQVAEFGPAFPH